MFLSTISSPKNSGVGVGVFRRGVKVFGGPCRLLQIILSRVSFVGSDPGRIKFGRDQIRVGIHCQAGAG